MLEDHDVAATLAVTDIDAARSFYEETLGLKPVMEAPDGVVYAAGNSKLMVYRSEFAGTNKATAATGAVGDQLESIVQELRANGVAFEHYDLPGTTRDGDIHKIGGMRGVWFKDPDGNLRSTYPWGQRFGTETRGTRTSRSSASPCRPGRETRRRRTSTGSGRPRSDRAGGRLPERVGSIDPRQRIEPRAVTQLSVTHFDASAVALEPGTSTA